MTCDGCPDMGRCCRLFTLSALFPPEATRDDVRRHLRAGTRPRHPRAPLEPLPFEPVRPNVYYARRGAKEPEEVKWSVTCPLLTPEGRCSSYDERPRPCRDYEPGRDPMCAKFEGPWRGLLHAYAEGEERGGDGG